MNSLFFIFSFFLISCNGLDNDENFLYSHKSTFLISSKSKLYRCVLQKDTLKINSLLENIHEGSLVDPYVLFLDTINQKLITFESPFETASERLLPKSYHVVNAWESFQVLSNANETLLEYNKKSKNESLELPKGSQYLFCNQGRAWLVQKRKVWVYDLNAGWLIDSFDLQRDFEFADYNSGYNLFVYTKDSSGLYQKYFDTNAISAGVETKVNFQKVQQTKVLTRLYETEYLKNVELNSQNKLNIPNFTEEVHSYDMDFQSSRLFFTRNDSLFVYHLNTHKKQFLKPNFGVIKKGLHFYSQN